MITTDPLLTAREGASQPDDEPQSAGVLLLRDIADVLETRQGERIGSTDLLQALCALEESPWADWRGGRPISTRGIAKLLKQFRVMPTRDMEARYYRRDSFTDAFGRYLSDAPQTSVTSVTSVMRPASVIAKHHNNNGMTPNDTYDA